MKKNNRKAFSLIELSIVILIIGIVIAGVTQSSILIKQFRLSTARTLTNSSPVLSMENLTMWLESTSENSLIEREAEDGNELSIWYDINPTKTSKINATQSNASYKPYYKEKCINSLPCINFAGAEYFDYNGTFLANTSYTIFIVEKRLSSANSNFFLGSEGDDVNKGLILGYSSETAVMFGQYANADTYDSIGSYTTPVSRIHSFVFTNGVSRKYYLNGQEKTLTPGGGADATIPILSNPDAHIGRIFIWSTAGTYYNGDIGEIIMFNTDVKAADRIAIETYLSKKWGIALQ